MEKVRSKQLFIIAAILFYVVTMLLPATAVAEDTYKFERMWPTLKQPWYFTYATGIATDAMGNVYVANRDNNRIQKFTSDGVFVKAWGSQGSGDGEFYGPSNIATDTQGFIYVADNGNSRIQKFTSDGIFVKAWGSQGSGDGEFYGPSGIATDTQGYVYVADGSNNRIQKFTSDGVFVKAWGSQGSGNGEFDGPVSIATDTQGYVYVGDFTSRIQKFTSDGVFVKAWGSEGSGDGQLWFPSGIATDAMGNVYVADYYHNRIQKFTSDGVFVKAWSAGTPRSMAIDAQGYIYVPNFICINKFTTDGSSVQEWCSSGSGNGEFYSPQGVATDAQGFIYVADNGNSRIQKFTSDGVFVKAWGSPGSGDGEFYGPLGIATDAMGNVYVADRDNNRIQKFTSDGIFVKAWGSKGLGDGEFESPSGIAADAQGYVYVGDYGNNRIQKFTSDGVFVKAWGSFGSGAGEFWCPSGIATDTQGYVYVIEFFNNRIQKFTSDGVFVNALGSAGSLPGQFSAPSFLAVGNNNKIFVTDSGNNRIQVFKPVIQAENPKAIIVAGGGPYEGNNLWNATQVSANFAYRALTYQGYSKSDIYYLSADTKLDLDNNGIADDVKAAPTKTALQQAITQWAVQEKADSLVLYLVDHGGSNTFRLSETEILTADEISGWLNELQQNMSGRIIVVYDACESGSFVAKLQGSNRIIITSTLPGEQAKFLGQGTISFSSFFWTHIFNGLSIEEAFASASLEINFAFANQSPQISGDGKDIYIGNGVKQMLGEAPEIGNVSPPQELANGTTATLYADSVIDPDGIARVWAVIWPPDYTPGTPDHPVIDLPSVDLMPFDTNPQTGAGRYEISYPLFDKDGTYHIAIYAMDRKGNTSLPKLTTVSHNYHITRRAVLVAGGTGANISRAAIEANAGLAYTALKAQKYTDDEIYFMSVTGVPGFDVAPSVFYFESYLNSLASDAGTGQLDLVLYLIGAGTAESFQMNDTETLTATELDRMLDTLQAQKPGSRVTIMYDGDFSGNFIPQLLPPAGEQRIVISSTCANAPAYFKGQGDASFSAFFWRQVASGAILYDGFAYARSALLYLSWREEIPFSCYGQQSPLLDADGNGVANEEADYRIARGCTIGVGIRFADDPPQIGAVSATEDSSSGIVTITAEDITSTKPLKRVWAVIKPMGYCPGASGEQTAVLGEVELTDGDGDGTYTGIYTPAISAFRISVFAMDAEDNTSAPQETKVYQRGGQPDIYEPDDTPQEANVIVVNYGATQTDGTRIGEPQPHTFHTANDEDWVVFYGLEEKSYIIEAAQLEEHCEPVMELYKSTNLQVPIAMSDTVVGGKVFLDWECPAGGEGSYYVRLLNKLAYEGGDKTGYSLKVYNGEQILWGVVAGKVKDKSGKPIDRAVVKTTGSSYSTLSQMGEYMLPVPPAQYQVTAQAPGYNQQSGTVTVPEGGITAKDFTLIPSANTTTTTVTSTTTTVPASCDITSVTPSKIEIGFGLLPRIKSVTVTMNTDLEALGITGRELRFNSQEGIIITIGVPAVIDKTVTATVLFWGVRPGTCTIQLGECGTKDIEIASEF